MSRKLLFARKGPRDKRIVEVESVLKTRPWLRLRHLAPMVDLSRSYLRHLFGEVMGVSIGDYAREQQLQKARDLLVSTRLPIKQIADEIGMCDHANFTVAFKKRFEMTPAAYRKRFRPPIAVFTTK